MSPMARQGRNLTVGLLLAAIGVLVPIGINGTISANGSICEAHGRNLGQARKAYSQTCSQPRVDCDPLRGIWVCSSQQIGDAAPARPSGPDPRSRPPEGGDASPSAVPATDPTTATTSPVVGSTVSSVPGAPNPTAVDPSTGALATSAVPTSAVPTSAAPGTSAPSTVSPSTPASTSPPNPAPGTGGGHGNGGSGHAHGPKPHLPNGLPTGAAGTSELLIVNKAPDTRSIRANVATFRMDCHFSHMNFDDVIVHPGKPGRAHLHVYFGNTSIDSQSNPMNLRDVGNSTCAGGRANRSAYWVPAVIDTNDGNRVLEPEGSIIYYKSGWAGGKPDKVVAPPNGLRVIAGDQANSQRSNQPYYKRNINWACARKGSISNNRMSDVMPTDCRPGELLVVRISFPQCWDGKNLDSHDHQSHMAYLTGSPENRQDCPASHPVMIPRMSVNAYFTLRSTDTSGLRLASDGYEMSKPGGLSAHADWIVGWDQQILERVLNGCFRPADDCGHNNFNDGQGLRYPRK